MTVENTQNKMPPLQMGTATEYPFTFAVLLQDPTEEEALEAIKASVLQADGTEIELEYGTDYTVTLNTDRIGGTLTVNNIRTASDYLTIYRQYEQTQEVDYKDFNSAPAETFEQCFDKLTMLSQQQQEEINRSLKLNVSSTTVNPTLPEPLANNTLIWDSVGSSLKNYDIIGENNQFKAEVNSAIAAGQAEIQAQFDAFENMIDTEIEDVREAATKINELEQAVEDAQTSATNAQTSATNAQTSAESATQAAQQTQADIQEIEEKIEEVGGMLSLEIGDIGFTQMAIDETKGKRRKLNGQIIIQDQYVQLTNIIKNSITLNPDLACTEEEWQTTVTMSAFGLCDKFVIDDEAGTIRLPKMPEYFIGGVNGVAPVVGNGMALGITNNNGRNGVLASSAGSYIGAWCSTNNNSNLPFTPTDAYNTNGFNGAIGVTTDPTKSGIEAQISTQQIKGAYFIQVATGAETEDNIINEIELNNPFSLLDYKFSEYELNNLSWLRSNSQYNSKAIYPAVYDLLLKIYNGTETKAGVSVKLSTEDYTDYDFVLNTAEETFRLPIKVKLASSKAVAGNGMTLGLQGYNTANTLLQGGLVSNGYVTGIGFSGDAKGKELDGTTTYPPVNFGGVLGLGVTTDATKSGLELSDSDLYLYFYVGETVQNANLINAGRIQEKVAEAITRMDCKAYVTETYVNGTSWYRVYSDGWCIQGGVIKTASTSRQTINLLKAYRDTNYSVFLNIKNATGNGNLQPFTESVNNLTTKSFTVYCDSLTVSRFWQTSGYIY